MEKSRELVTEYHIPLQDTQRPGERQNVLIEASTETIRITAEGDANEVVIERRDGQLCVDLKPKA